MSRARSGAKKKPQKGGKKTVPSKPRAPAPVIRSLRPATELQELFVREYLIDLSPADAYMRAYKLDNRDSAQACAGRLLLNVTILAAIDRQMRARMDRLELDADWVVLGFRMAYLRAMQESDLPSAIKALENIGKFLGIYERNNAQKKPRLTPEELAQLKARLEMMGFDFSRKNYPAHLVGVPPGHPPRPLPETASHDPADLRGPVHGPTGADRPDLHPEGGVVPPAPR